MKKGKMKRGIKALVGLATVFGMCTSFVSNSAIEAEAEGTTSWTIDANTSTGYTDTDGVNGAFKENDTSDVGRIWTDKSV